MITVERVNSGNMEQFLTLLATFWEPYRSESFFMSRAWLEAWIQSLPQTPHFTAFYESGTLVGFVPTQTRALHRALPCFQKQYFNQWGLQRYDQVWIEYNRIYCLPDKHAVCVNALLEHFPDHRATVQLYISMAAEQRDWLSTATAFRMPAVTQKVAGFKRALSATCTVDSIIQSLSKSSRSQVRRALKKAESVWGPISVISSAEQSQLEDFYALGEIHKARWRHTPEGSGFSNEAFLSHHKHIIQHFPQTVDILTVKAGSHVLGMCYNFLCNKRVEFYCCGIEENVPDKHIKPGYLVHIACMAYYAERGFTEYDFLGGEAQYKQTLADCRYSFYNLTIWANSFPARVARGLAKLKALVNREP